MAHLFSSGSEHHDPEDEEHAEPHLPNNRGVGLHLIQQRGKKAPLSHGFYRQKGKKSKIQYKKCGKNLSVNRISVSLENVQYFHNLCNLNTKLLNNVSQYHSCLIFK